MKYNVQAAEINNLEESGYYRLREAEVKTIEKEQPRMEAALFSV
ncbi:hypothetical protein [Lysinibacillus sp. NPDC096259]